MKDAHLQEARGILLSGTLVACLLLVAGAPAKYLSVHAILHISALSSPRHHSDACVWASSAAWFSDSQLGRRALERRPCAAVRPRGLRA